MAAKAVKLESGKWRVYQYLGRDSFGKKVYRYYYGKTKKEAEYRALEGKIIFQREQEKQFNPFETITLFEAMEKYIEMKSRVLSPSTIYGYNMAKNHYFKDIEHIMIGELNNAVIQNSLNHLAAIKSAKTVRNASGFLSAVLKEFRPEFIYRVTLPKPKKQLKELPEAEKIMEAVRGTNVELAVLLAMWLSMRESEVRGLKRSDITADGHLLVHHVRLCVGGVNVEREATKTVGSTRKLRIPTYIMKLINDLPADQEYLVPERAQTVTRRFYACLDKAGIPRITFHDLRHLNASIMLLLGIPEKYAMERGGWSTPTVLQSVYQHTFSEERKVVDDKIDDYFNTIICNQNEKE